MKVNFFYPYKIPYEVALNYNQIEDIIMIIDEYEDFRKFFINHFDNRNFKVNKIDQTSLSVFDVLEGNIDKYEVQILLAKKIPFILFIFSFEISDISEVDNTQITDELMIISRINFNEVLITFLKTRNKFTLWKKLRLLDWKWSSMQFLSYYYFFEIFGNQDEEILNKISDVILSKLFTEEYIKSHWYYGELFELFCSKSFSILFYQSQKSNFKNKFIHLIKDSIRDIYLLNEISLEYIQNLNFLIESLIKTQEKEELMEWMLYLKDMTYPFNVLISNRELMRGPGEDVFGICSKLNGLDQTFHDVELAINLRSVLINTSLQKSIEKYTKIIIILTIIMVSMTFINIIACYDDLLKNLALIFSNFLIRF